MSILVPLSLENLQKFGKMFCEYATAKEEERLANRAVDLGDEESARMHYGHERLARENLEEYLDGANEDLRTAWTMVQLTPRES